MGLWSVDFQVIIVGPEPTGQVQKSPRLNAAAELSRSAVWEGSDETGEIGDGGRGGYRLRERRGRLFPIRGECVDFTGACRRSRTCLVCAMGTVCRKCQ